MGIGNWFAGRVGNSMQDAGHAGSGLLEPLEQRVLLAVTLFVDNFLPDGTWPGAYTDLQDALAVAVPGDDIWVAAGTYYPTAAADRTISFDMVAGVAMYGGFVGGEAALSQRDWDTNQTILSGDIGTVGVTTDNSYHVVVGADDAILDGFVVTGGRGSSTGGGGMYNVSVSPRVRNTTFTENYASQSNGGGMLNDNASPDVVNCAFLYNQVGEGRGAGMANDNGASPNVVNTTFIGNFGDDVLGAGMANYFSSPVVINALFQGNVADANRGGGMWNSNGTPTIADSTFVGNFADSVGGAIYNSSASPRVGNSIFWDNRSSAGNDNIYNSGLSSPVISYSDIQDSGGSGGGWDASVGIDGGGNIDSNPLLVNPGYWDDNGTPGTFWDDAWVDNGDYHLQQGSPAVDAADNTAVPADSVDLDNDLNTTERTPLDLDGLPRFIDDPLVVDTGVGVPTVDMGAYEYPASPAKWIQWPDVTTNGIDIRVDDGRVLADDFECTFPSLLTDVHLWGSWRGDVKGRILNIHLSVHDDDPEGLGGSDPDNTYSKPEQEELWGMDFGPGQFDEHLYAVVPQPGEYWWDPAFVDGLIPGGDTQVWQVDIDIDPVDAFLQTGAPNSPIIYWLDVSVKTEFGQFGWKTRQWPDHYMDDAVWDRSTDPPIEWKELRYPPGHPYHDQQRDSIDMSFMLTFQEAALDWGDAPDSPFAPGYPTRAINNGANHRIAGPWLGGMADVPDAEGDGQQDPYALGDDNDGNDDENGVRFTSPLIVGQQASVDVYASAQGYLNAWVDFDGDGSWAQPNDQIFGDELLGPGLNSLTFNVPPSATGAGDVVTFARFRFNSVGGLSYDGTARDGEVEDHRVRVGTAPRVSAFGLSSTSVWWFAGTVDSSVWTAGRPARTAPWGVIDQLVVNLDEVVLAGLSHLTIVGQLSGPVAVWSLAGSGSSTLTWSLGSYLKTDRYTVTVSDSVIDPVGFALDGEPWGDLFPSGNGLPGGDWSFDLNVLPGDATGDGFVGQDDLDTVLGNWGGTVPPGDPASGDLSGDGFVGQDDLDTVLGNWGGSLPPPPPASSMVSIAATVADDEPSAPSLSSSPARQVSPVAPVASRSSERRVWRQLPHRAISPAVAVDVLADLPTSPLGLVALREATSAPVGTESGAGDDLARGRRGPVRTERADSLRRRPSLRLTGWRLPLSEPLEAPAGELIDILEI